MGDESRLPMPSRAVIGEFDPKAHALSIAEGVAGSIPFHNPLGRAI